MLKFENIVDVFEKSLYSLVTKLCICVRIYVQVGMLLGTKTVAKSLV